MSFYVSSEYYIETFQGKIPKEDIKKYLEQAQQKIDSITFNRIVKIGFDNLTEFQKDRISKAICYQADYIYGNGYNNEENSDISSYSVLDISVNVQTKDNTSKTEAEKKCMSEIAYDYVKQTGLNSLNWRFNG
ncbi:MAG: hypothetical protein V8R01_01590 [Bacilli bacterium]